MTVERPDGRRRGILSDAIGGLVTFLVEAAVVVVSILAALGVAALVLFLV